MGLNVDISSPQCNVFGFSLDGAQVNSCVCDNLDAAYLWCVAHMTALAMNETLVDAGGASGSSGGTFEKLLKKGRLLVSTIKSSSVKTFELREIAAIAGESAELRNPNDTRWESNVTMLETILRAKDSLSDLESLDDESTLTTFAMLCALYTSLLMHGLPVA
jgi:hypothetical protein